MLEVKPRCVFNVVITALRSKPSGLVTPDSNVTGTWQRARNLNIAAEETTLTFHIYLHFTTEVHLPMPHFIPLLRSHVFCRLWACGRRRVNVCLASPGGWSSGIQQTLLECQSGLTEIQKALAAIPEFSFSFFFTPDPQIHKHTHTRALSQAHFAELAKPGWTLLFSPSMPSLSLPCLFYHCLSFRTEGDGGMCAGGKFTTSPASLGILCN